MSNQQEKNQEKVPSAQAAPVCTGSRIAKFFLITVIVLLFVCIVGLIAGMAKTQQETAIQLKQIQEDSRKEIENSRKEIESSRKEIEAMRLATENITKQLQDSQANLEIMEQATAEMGRGFKIMSARDVKLQGLSFAQPIVLDTDRALAKSIGKQLKAKTPADLVAAAEKVLQNRAAASRDLQIDSETGNVFDPVAGIVELAAKEAGLNAATKIAWDIEHKKFSVLTAIIDPKGKLQKASYSSLPKLVSESTFQTSPKSTIFPFTSITLMSNAERIIFDRSACIPLGGAYIHYFRVFAKEAWTLEYDFPAGIEPESVNLNLLMLSPGVSASSSPSNGRMKFFLGASNTETSFLVFADKPFFPLRASINLTRK